MRTCSYCGAEYNDDVVECPIDKTSLGAKPSEPACLHRVTAKQETAILTEFVKIYRAGPEQVARYRRAYWVWTVGSWGLIFSAFLLISFRHINVVLCVLLALLGGVSAGIGGGFAASARQIPFLVRFTTLDEEAVNRRLEELENS